MGNEGHDRRRSCLLSFVLTSRPPRRYSQPFTSSTSCIHVEMCTQRQNVPCRHTLSSFLICHEAPEAHIGTCVWFGRCSSKDASIYTRSHQDTTQHTRASSEVLSTLALTDRNRFTGLRQTQDAASNIKLPQSRHRHRASITQCCPSMRRSKTLES